MDPIRFTPTLRSSGVWPELNNGSLHGVYDEDGTWAAIRLTIGTATTRGTGRWWFEGLPVATGGAGTGIAKHGLTAWTLVVVIVERRVEVFSEDEGQGVSATHPFIWEPDDTLALMFGEVPDGFRW